MKLEHITTSEDDTFEITDAHGITISLSPREALLVSDWLNQRRSELLALIYPEEVSNPYQLSRGFYDAMRNDPESNT